MSKQISDAELKQLVEDISYPGYALQRHPNDPRQLRWVTTDGHDNFGRYGHLTVEWQYFTVPDEYDRRAALRLILGMILYAEDHEARERFRVKGKAVFSPHIHGARVMVTHEHLEPHEHIREFDIIFRGDHYR